MKSSRIGASALRRLRRPDHTHSSSPDTPNATHGTTPLPPRPPAQRAAMVGKPCADIDDVRSVAHLVLRHRVLTNFKARAEGVDTGSLLDGLVKTANA